MDTIYWVAAGGTVPAGAYLLSGGRWHHIDNEADLLVYEAAQPPFRVVGSATGARISAAEAEALAADYPAGNPAVTVNTPTPTFPAFQITGSATPA